MSMFIQLNPMLPVDTPKGTGFAFALIDMGQEFDTLYKVIITASREIWDVPQPQVKGVVNWSMGRGEGAMVHRAANDQTWAEHIAELQQRGALEEKLERMARSDRDYGA